MLEEIVCYCKGVIKSEIIKAIELKNANRIEDIQRITQASTGCGRCTNYIKIILNEFLPKKNNND